MWNRKIALGAALALVIVVPAAAHGSSASPVPVVARASSAPPALPVGYDQTPPVLTVDVKPAFVVGNLLTPEQYDPTVWYTGNIAQFIHWSATDDSGRVCAYDLFERFAGTHPLLEYSQETQYTYMTSDYEGSYGGEQGVVYALAVTAWDCSLGGNGTTKVIAEHVTVNEENNTDWEGGTTFLSGQLTYKGPWATTYCDCFLGGKSARTSTQGARMTFTRTYGQGDHVALVMAEGPGRGVVSIRIDDRWLMFVDTYAPVNTNAVVVFEYMMSAGTHTVAIVNQGTPGRPRIDLDAVMTN